MMDGIYSAVFASNNNMMGSGIAIFSGGTVYGGDSAFYYRGKFRLDDKKQISATIEVFKHTDILNSVFGPLNSFKLILNGVESSQGFTLSGPREGQPTNLITIALKRVDDLIEA